MILVFCAAAAHDSVAHRLRHFSTIALCKYVHVISNQTNTRQLLGHDAQNGVYLYTITTWIQSSRVLMATEDGS